MSNKKKKKKEMESLGGKINPEKTPLISKSNKPQKYETLAITKITLVRIPYDSGFGRIGVLCVGSRF